MQSSSLTFDTIHHLAPERRTLTATEQTHIESTFLRGCSNADNPAFREIVAGLVVAFGHGTPEESRKTEIETAKQIVEAEQQLAQIIGGCTSETVVPAKYRGTTYDEDYWPELSAAIRRVVTADIAGYRPGDIYVHGPSHTGKSHGMAHLALMLHERGKRVCWLNCPRLRNLYEDGITNKDAKQLAVGMKSSAIDAQILVLDDIGKDETTSASGDKRTLSYFGRTLYEIIEERQGISGHITLFTSEFALSEELLVSRLTQAVVNRIQDRATIVGDAPRVKYKTWLEHRANLPGIIPMKEVAG